MTEGWWKYAKPGDKVVCVGKQAKLVDALRPVQVLSVGDVYEVSEVVQCSLLPASNGIGICLASFGSLIFSPLLLRPAQTKSTETGMTILKAILNGAPVKEDA